MAGKVRFDQRNTERGPEWDVWCDDMYLGLICETPEGWTTSIPGIRNLFPTAEVAMAWVKSHWHREDERPAAPAPAWPAESLKRRG